MIFKKDSYFLKNEKSMDKQFIFFCSVFYDGI